MQRATLELSLCKVDGQLVDLLISAAPRRLPNTDKDGTDTADKEGNKQSSGFGVVLIAQVLIAQCRSSLLTHCVREQDIV